MTDRHLAPPAGQRLPLDGKRILMVLVEYPTTGTAGFHSYNRAVLASMLEQGASVCAFVLEPRYRKLYESIRDLGATDRLAIVAPGLLRRRDMVAVAGIRALAGYAYRQVKLWWTARRQLQTTPAASRVRIGRFMSSRQVASVKAKIRDWQPDLLMLDTLFMAPVIGQVGRLPKVVVAHDVFHQRVENLQRAGMRPEPVIDYSTERSLLLTADAVLAISEADAVAFRSMGLPSPVQVFSPPVELRPPSKGGNPHTPRLFYMGSAAHHNVHALTWFISNAWPLLRSRWPNLELVVAGDVGAAALPSPPEGVTCVGRVEDPGQAAQGCIAAIDPVQAGSGVKIKIITYLSIGLPCITSPSGALGLEDFSAGLVVASEPEDYATALGAICAATTPAAQRQQDLRVIFEARHRSEHLQLSHLVLDLLRRGARSPARGCRPMPPN